VPKGTCNDHDGGLFVLSGSNRVVTAVMLVPWYKFQPESCFRTNDSPGDAADEAELRKCGGWTYCTETDMRRLGGSFIWLDFEERGMQAYYAIPYQRVLSGKELSTWERYSEEREALPRIRFMLAMHGEDPNLREFSPGCRQAVLDMVRNFDYLLLGGYAKERQVSV